MPSIGMTTASRRHRALAPAAPMLLSHDSLSYLSAPPPPPVPGNITPHGVDARAVHPAWEYGPLWVTDTATFSKIFKNPGP